MKNYEIIQKNLMLKINTILKQFEISPKDFLCKHNKKNLDAHETILGSLPPMLENEKVRTQILTENRKKQIDIAHQFKDIGHKNSPEYQICSIIKAYLYDFYDTFYSFKNGEPENTFAEDFFLPSIEDNPDSSANFKYILNKLRQYPRETSTELETIILPNGETFFAPIDHETLAYWLNINGVNLHNAIRFESSQSIRDFNFSSLFNDKFAESDTEKETIQISSKQAEILGVLYESLEHGWHFMRPLHDQFKHSSGFGIGKTEKFDNEGISGKNLRTLDLYMGKHFNKCEYIREARLSNDAHSPLN